MEFAVRVVPGVQREFRLGNVVFAAASALLHLSEIQPQLRCRRDPGVRNWYELAFGSREAA